MNINIGMSYRDLMRLIVKKITYKWWIEEKVFTDPNAISTFIDVIDLDDTDNVFLEFYDDVVTSFKEHCTTAELYTILCARKRFVLTEAVSVNGFQVCQPSWSSLSMMIYIDTTEPSTVLSLIDTFNKLKEQNRLTEAAYLGGNTLL
jgi:hypothetical protein